MGGDEVDQQRVFEDADVRVRLRRAQQHGFDALAGDVAGVQHAAAGVAALAAQVVARPAVGPRRKGHAQALELGDARRRVRHDAPHHGLVAQARARVQRVGHVPLDAVAGLHHAGDPALRVVRVALGRFLLGRQQHAAARREVQRAHQAGDAAAGDEILAGFDPHRPLP